MSPQLIPLELGTNYFDGKRFKRSPSVLCINCKQQAIGFKKNVVGVLRGWIVLLLKNEYGGEQKPCCKGQVFPAECPRPLQEDVLRGKM